MIVKSMLVRIGADTTEMQTGLDNARSSMKKHAQKFKDAGKKMMIAGAAITGAIGLMVKKASDAQETTSKFGTIFEDVFSKASVQVNELTKNYGLSDLAAKTMLSSTGDLLTGLGLGGEAALGLSAKTQKLAVDLASFSNFAGGAKGASEALTKAMLGERESVKALGIVITEEMVKEQLLKEGKEALTGQSLLQAKAEATLAIAVSQSKNAIGDYQRTSGSLANVTRELRARFEDLVVEVGAKLIPIVTSLAQSVKVVIGKVIAWIKENPKLISLVTKIALGIGVLLTVLGPLVMILPALAAGFALLMGPIGIVIGIVVALAALAFLVIKNWGKIKVFFVNLWGKIKEIFFGVVEFIFEKVIWLMEKLAKIPIIKKFVKNIQAGLEDAKASLAAARENIEFATEKMAKDTEEAGETIKTSLEEVGTATKTMTTRVSSLYKTMTDEVMKATLSEYEYSKWTAEKKYEERKVLLEKEIEEGKAQKEELLLLEQAHQVTLAELDKETKEDERVRREEAFASYMEAKLQLTDAINQMTMSEVEYSKWALESSLQILDQEYQKRKEHIKRTIENEEEKKKLLGLLDAEYWLRKEKAEKDHADKLTDIQANTLSAMTSLYGYFISDTLDAFEDWGAGTQSLLKGIAGAFKNLAKGAIQALKDIVIQEALTAAKTFIAEKAKAVAKVITSVMAAIPFPFNLLAVGGAIAAVTLLFSKIKLFKEGGFVPKETLAMLHPGEFVVSAPVVKALSQPGAGFGGGFILKQTNHFYGDISNVGDLDEISNRLGKKVQRAVERGRK